MSTLGHCSYFPWRAENNVTLGGPSFKRIRKFKSERALEIVLASLGIKEVNLTLNKKYHKAE